MADTEPSPGKGRSFTEKAAALTASGVLALTLAGESASAMVAQVRGANTYEVAGKKDPLSQRLERQMNLMVGDINQIVTLGYKNAEHRHYTDNGSQYDRYTFALPMPRQIGQPEKYNQIVCMVKNRQVEGCSLLLGVDDPLKPGQAFELGQFLVRDTKNPNNFTLENIYQDPQGEWIEDYYIKKGNTYIEKARINKGNWHTRKVAPKKLGQAMEDFTSNSYGALQQIIQYMKKGKPPANKSDNPLAS